MDRRSFLLATGMTLLPVGRSAWAAQTRDAASGTQRKLVVVMLRGAVDGLNVVIPHGDATYYHARPGIAVPRPGQADGAIDLDGYFGLHPALASLMPLWQQRRLAFVHAAGSPDATRSHFDAQDYLESGTPGRKSTPDGWMNRLLAALPGASTPTRAISVGPVMPRILSGRMAATNIAAGSAAKRPVVLDRPAIAQAFSQLYAGDDAMSRAYREARQARQEVMSSLAEEMEQANNGAPLPNGFIDDARHLAQLMRNDARVQLAFVGLGGWDTHANQGAAKGQLAKRLAPLGDGLAVLARELGRKFDDTVVVVVSEFGRTVQENGNHGTDHGHGNVMWLLGGNVVGGKVHGQWPGLEEGQRYEGRDLAVTTDFRTPLMQVAERHLQLSDAQLAQIFPDAPVSQQPLRLMV